jgi:signal transduction histidine kinase
MSSKESADSSEKIFNTIIASSVHDMKNSLVLLLQTIENICRDEDVKAKHIKEYGILQYEARRLNSSLVQMLSIYKLGQDRLPINYQYLDLENFLDDVMAQHIILFEAKGIKYTIECDYDLYWSFDPDLIAGVLDNVITNSIRYTRDNLHIFAYIDSNESNGDELIIEITDNGPGYPTDMLSDPENYIHQTNFSTGSTGLGLFFSAQVAKMHGKDGHFGRIELDNKQDENGGIFKIKIP